MSTIKAGNIRKGSYILFKNEPHLVTKTDFMSPGKGSAVMRVRYKSVKTGNTQEFTHKSTESVEELDISSRRMQYLYHDADEVVLMEPATYEQLSVKASLLDDKLDLLTPELEIYALLYNDQAIGFSLPHKIKLKVTHADEAVAGDTVGQARKEVEMETGLKVMAPLFVKTGDVLLIDTETKSYVSRV